MTNKICCISTSTRPIATKHGKLVIYCQWQPAIKSHDPIITLCYVVSRPMALGKILIYRERLAPIKSHDSLITWLTRGDITNWKKLFFHFYVDSAWRGGDLQENPTHQIIWRHAKSWEVMSQIKKFMFPLLEDLSPPNFTELWLTMRRSNQ